MSNNSVSIQETRLRTSLNENMREKCSHISVYAALFPAYFRSNGVWCVFKRG